MNDWLYQGSPYVGEDEMIQVGIDINCLQERLMLANLEICDKCIQEDMAVRAEKANIPGKVTTKVIYNGAYLACPLYVGRLDLTEAKKMPRKCRYRLEHMVVNQRETNVK